MRLREAGSAIWARPIPGELRAPQVVAPVGRLRLDRKDSLDGRRHDQPDRGRGRDL